MDQTLSPSVPRAVIGKRIVPWLALASAILILIFSLIFRSITELVRSNGWVAHSYQVLDTLDVTQAFFLDAEAAERGYVATCKPTMISPFRHDVPQIFSKLATLRMLTEDNAAHRERVRQLNHTMTAELERMSAIINTAHDGRPQIADIMLTDEANTRATQAVASLLSAMEKDERALLDGRLSKERGLAWTTLVTCGAGVISIFAILGFVFWLIRRETGRRERTEASLQQSKEKLESSLLELHRYNAWARAISLLGELLQTCRTTQEALSISARHLQDLLPDTAMAIALINNSRDGVEVAQSAGEGALFAPIFRSDDCWGLRRGRIHHTTPTSFEPHCSHVEAPGAHTLCLPMMAQGETLGIMTFARAPLTIAQGAPFSEMERQSMQTVTEQLSLALANLKLQDTLRNQSLRDPLTGLYNRRYMDEALAREINRAARQGAPLSVAMVDVDHFKRFNDSYGHEGGDALLQAFGVLLAGRARAEDIVCRYGGEEFAVILPGADQDTAMTRMDELRQETARLHVEFHGRPLGRVTISSGVAAYSRDGATGASLLAAADAALYRAKKSGRDRVVGAGEPPALHAANTE